MALDRAAVAHIAALARIRITEAELDRVAADLSQILAWFEQLNEIDTSGVAPMASVVATCLPMREDLVTDGDCREAILGNAPRACPGPRTGSGRGGAGIDRDFFAVPKVIG
jgi:aspartyl-tRNA(Asn)/glutamyl-tRNA(Gln) amidotransferase subunit C